MLNVDAIVNIAAVPPKAQVQLAQPPDGDKGAFAKEMQSAVQKQTPAKPLKHAKAAAEQAAEQAEPQEKADESAEAAQNELAAQSPNPVISVPAVAPALAAATVVTDLTAAGQSAANPFAAASVAAEPIASAPAGSASITSGFIPTASAQVGASAALQAMSMPQQTNTADQIPQTELPSQQPSEQASAGRGDTIAQSILTAQESPAQTPGQAAQAVQQPQVVEQATQPPVITDSTTVAAAPESAQPISAELMETVQAVTTEPYKPIEAQKSAKPAGEPIVAVPVSPDAPAEPIAAQTAQANGDRQQPADGGQDASTFKTDAAQQPKGKPVKAQSADAEPAQVVDVKLTPKAAADLQASEVKEAVVAKIADKIDELVQAEKNQVKIQLKPDVLGGMTIKLSLAQSGLKVHLLTNGSETHALVNDQIAQLKESLRERGITVVQMEVVDQSAAQTSSQPSFAREQQQSRYKSPAAHTVKTEAAAEIGSVYSSMIRMEGALSSVEFSA